MERAELGGLLAAGLPDRAQPGVLLDDLLLHRFDPVEDQPGEQPGGHSHDAQHDQEARPGVEQFWPHLMAQQVHNRQEEQWDGDSQPAKRTKVHRRYRTARLMAGTSRPHNVSRRRTTQPAPRGAGWLARRERAPVWMSERSVGGDLEGGSADPGAAVSTERAHPDPDEPWRSGWLPGHRGLAAGVRGCGGRGLT